MRTLSILTAAAIGLAASTGFANAQATNTPKPAASKQAKPKKATAGQQQRAVTGERRVRSSPALDHAGNMDYLP